MKKFLLLTLLSVMTLAVSVSCSKEPVYSCDKEVDEWTKSNLEAIQQMDRTEWSKLELKYQKGAYRAFSGNQRIDLWRGKITEALSLDWSAKERAHLVALLKIVESNPTWFSNEMNNNEAEQDNMTLTMYRWMEYATETLKWNKDLLYAIVATPQKMIDKTGDLYGTPLTKGPIGPAGDSCNCNFKSDWCRNTTCSPARCNEQPQGCGTLWMTACNGTCQ